MENIIDDFAPDGLMDDMVSPLDSVVESYQPNVDKSNILAELKPGDYDNLVKVLQILNKEKDDDVISIKQSTVTKGNSDCVIQADMTPVLKDNNGKPVDLDIVNPKRYIRLLEQFRSQDSIFIIDDDGNSRFVLTNGEVKLFLPKSENILDQDVESFDIEDSVGVCEKKIDKDTRRIIKNLAKDQDYIDYLIQDDQLKAIYIPDTAVYTFSEFKTDERAQNLNETNADLILRSSNFLPVESEEYQLYLLKKGDDYISITDCSAGGKIAIRVSESLEVATDGNLIF